MAELKNTNYEWCIEEIDEHGDIIDNNFSDKVNAFDLQIDVDGTRFKLVLVRETYDPWTKGWAYARWNGAEWILPNAFMDAYNRFVAEVPKRFYKELERAQK